MLALLDAEQQMLKEVAGQIARAAEVANPGDLKTRDRAAAWESLAQAGLLGLRVRDEEGRPSASGVEVAVVAEALGAGLVPVPYLGSAVLATELLALAGAGPEAEELAAGGKRAGILLNRDLSAPARLPGDEQGYAWDCDGAAEALALVEAPGGAQVVRVPLDGAFTPVAGADLTRSLARYDAPIDPSGLTRAGRPLTEAELARWEALALAALCADTVGVMRSAVTKAVEYAKERIQYGVPIGSFQAVQHMCAEAYVSAEAAASATGYAAWAVDVLEPGEALTAARTAKAQCGAVAREVTETVMQIFGGIGQTYEHIAHVHTRRALTDRQVLGDEDAQLLRIADVRLTGE
ncbi:alkylation response protein AidB-like acyl-CoA dehydrogenase [Thermocatellispora tengchongensis]|uniref:Alkylation response protein AidB-like acyl-CoA dehydrogenase n=1 Tax=Thermocatellispora tengchongensis TaxID=1073253 RepID=A0A840PPT2_9ACTN|nr:acyl-CoA dehydrogenase [Thermocatellispora tengchongensis]MBB5139781.1 alkylation response protein AidB-like acyl-CoA dehydrogenase [Thermocatellispora tengchongensis]